MKLVSFTNRKPVVIPARESVGYTRQISNAIDREIIIGHIADVTDDDRQALLTQANDKIAKILAAGLKLCTRSDGELRCFLLTRHDHLTTADHAPELYRLAKYYGGIGCYISDTGYYNLGLPTALADLEIGEYGTWVFAVYDENAEGFQAYVQAMFTGFKWSKQEELFDAFAAKFAAAGTVFSLDHASQGLLHAHDLRLPDWNTDALGRNGCNRFIKLPAEVEIDGTKQRLFPYGGADAFSACWGVCDWDFDAYYCGVVALVG